MIVGQKWPWWEYAAAHRKNDSFYSPKAHSTSIFKSSKTLRPTLLYYQDKLEGKKLARVYVRGGPERAVKLMEAVRERYELETTGLDPARVVSLEGLDAEQKNALAPALGAALGR